MSFTYNERIHELKAEVEHLQYRVEFLDNVYLEARTDHEDMLTAQREVERLQGLLEDERSPNCEGSLAFYVGVLEQDVKQLREEEQALRQDINELVDEKVDLRNEVERLRGTAAKRVLEWGEA